MLNFTFLCTLNAQKVYTFLEGFLLLLTLNVNLNLKFKSQFRKVNVFYSSTSCERAHAVGKVEAYNLHGGPCVMTYGP